MKDVHWHLEVFAARADARAILWSAALLTLHDAVDELHATAERDCLIKLVGQDQIQKIISDAFMRRENAGC